MKPIISGDSVTLQLIFPDSYDIANLVNIIVGLNKVEIARLSSSTVLTTDDERVFLVKIKSEDSKKLKQAVSLQIALIDSQFGVKHTDKMSLYFTEADFSIGETIVNSLSDVSVIINISEAGITTNVTLATIAHGYSAYEMAVLYNGYTGTEEDYQMWISGKQTLTLTDAEHDDILTHDLDGVVKGFFFDEDNIEDESVKVRYESDGSIKLKLGVLDGITGATVTGKLLLIKVS